MASNPIRSKVTTGLYGLGTILGLCRGLVLRCKPMTFSTLPWIDGGEFPVLGESSSSYLLSLLGGYVVLPV